MSDIIASLQAVNYELLRTAYDAALDEEQENEQ
jgi:hypothetical protein